MRTASAPASPRRTAPTSLLCTIRRDTALSTTGSPGAVAAAAAASGVGAVIVSAATCTPYAASSRLTSPSVSAPSGSTSERASGSPPGRVGGVIGAARRASCSATSARTRSASSLRSK